jgi:hypothetical protein
VYSDLFVLNTSQSRSVAVSGARAVISCVELIYRRKSQPIQVTAQGPSEVILLNRLGRSLTGISD